MPWQKMRFRGDAVFVHVDDGHRIVLDGDGRAEMKYRESDPKSYRPGPANLTPWPAEASEPTTGDREGHRPAGAPEPRRAPSIRKTAAPAKRGGSTATREAPSTEPQATHPDAAATFHVWTDGACSGNPGPMGIGVVVIAGGAPGAAGGAGGDRQEIGEYLGIGTNNIAELVAIERGLEVVAARLRAAAGTPGAPGPTGVRAHVRVYSDSGYAIGLLSQGWKAKANQELVARIRRGLAAFPGRVEFVKVPGHAGVPENERCDELGRDAIASARRRPASAR